MFNPEDHLPAYLHTHLAGGVQLHDPFFKKPAIRLVPARILETELLSQKANEVVEPVVRSRVPTSESQNFTVELCFWAANKAQSKIDEYSRAHPFWVALIRREQPPSIPFPFDRMRTRLSPALRGFRSDFLAAEEELSFARSARELAIEESYFRRPVKRLTKDIEAQKEARYVIVLAAQDDSSVARNPRLKTALKDGLWKAEASGQAITTADALSIASRIAKSLEPDSGVGR